MKNRIKKIIIAIIVVVAISTIVIVIKLFLSPSSFFNKEKEEAPNVQVSGAILDLKNEPVTSVDLVVDDTKIKTGESGQFIFPSVNVKTGIRLTYPSLLRAIVKLPDSSKEKQITNILFDEDLYNSLITIIDAEARGGAVKTYEYLNPEIKNKLSFEEFENQYQSIFGTEDITDQEIVIKKINRQSNYYEKEFKLRFAEMVEFKVENGDKSKIYKLVLSDDRWQLIP